MAGFRALAAKGIRDLAFSPAAYVSALFFLLACGIPFLFPPESALIPDFSLGSYASRIPLAAAVFFPALAGSLWDHERKSGTIDILLSLPVSDVSIVIAKIIPSFAAYAGTLALTVPLSLSLGAIGGTFSLSGTIVSGYAMLLLFGLSLSSFTAYVSLRISGTIVPTIASSACILALDTLHELPSLFDLSERVSRLCVGLSFAWHLDGSFRGIVDSRDIVYFLAIAILFVSLGSLRLAAIRKAP